MKKMYNVTLGQAKDYIKDRIMFRASNLYAVAYDDGSYSIFSYATCIYMENDEEIVINRLNEYFSCSTSRHQSIVRRALNIK